MIQIPNNRQWSQNNISDVLGSIWSSFNCDLTSNEGKLRISPRMVVTTDDVSNLGVAVGFVRFNNSTNGNGYYTVAGDRFFNTDVISPSDAFAASSDNNTTFSSDTADIIFFKKANRLVGSAQTTLVSFTSSSGATAVAGTPLTGGTPHMMCDYGVRLYCTNNYKTIISADTSMNTTATGNPNTFSLGTLDTNQIGLRIIDILSSSSGIYILTSTSQYGEPARVYTWDGATQDDPSAEYILETSGIMAGIMKDDVLYILTAEAELLAFNGGTFARLPNGKLPVNPNKYLKNSFSSVNDRWIHPRGITLADNGKINIFINNEYEDGTIEERLPSGIWEYDTLNPYRGWYHKNSPSLYVYGAGDPYAITDYGQVRVSRVGALTYVKTPNKPGAFLAGAQLYSDASATKEVIMTNDTADTVRKYGSIVTPWVYSDQIDEAWQYIIPRFRKLSDDDSKVIVKYRTTEDDPTEISITWASTTTFTTTSSFFSVGDEVEITQGTGAGQCAHITNISSSGGTQTVTLDQTFEGATGTAKARFQKWIKAGEVVGKNLELERMGIGSTAPRIQIKVCFRNTGITELNDILLINQTHQQAK